MTLVVSIGRNVGDEPMSTEEWLLFKHEVRDSMNIASAVVYAEAEGQGEWEGVGEETCVWIFSVVSDMRKEELRHELADLSDYFQQDAIAWLEGETEFLTGR